MSSSEKEKLRDTPASHPSYPHPLELRCAACGKKGKYRVGRICIDPRLIGGGDGEKRSRDEGLSFTGLFHCRHCGSGGPWQQTSQTMLALIALMTTYKQNPEESPLVFGTPALFDGTVLRTASERVEYLNRLIEAAPDDYFLQERLGNLYISADRDDLARPCFEKAIKLNPDAIEARHSLAEILFEEGQTKQALQHCRQIIQRCRRAPARSSPILVRKIVIDVLYQWLELNDSPKQALDNLPRFEPAEPGGDGTIPHSLLRDLDLPDEKGLEILADIYLTGRLPGPRRLPAPGASGTSFMGLLGSRSERVGRNERCPCGSGRKYKHCCGRKK